MFKVVTDPGGTTAITSSKGGPMKFEDEAKAQAGADRLNAQAEAFGIETRYVVVAVPE